MRLLLPLTVVLLLAGCSSVSMDDFPDDKSWEPNQALQVDGWDVLVTGVDLRVSPHTDCFTGCGPHYHAEYAVAVEVMRLAEGDDLALRLEHEGIGVRAGGREPFERRSSPVVPFSLPVGELWKGSACVSTPTLDVRKTHHDVPLTNLTLDTGGPRASIVLGDAPAPSRHPARNTTGDTEIQLGQAFEVGDLRYTVTASQRAGAYAWKILVENPTVGTIQAVEPMLHANDRNGTWVRVPEEPYSFRCSNPPVDPLIALHASANATFERILPFRIGKANYAPAGDAPPAYLEVAGQERLMRVAFDQV